MTNYLRNNGMVWIGGVLMAGFLLAATKASVPAGSTVQFDWNADKAKICYANKCVVR